MRGDHRHRTEGRLICFSRSNRCPICQRPDGKCRHRGEFYHCWKGNTFSPPDVAINSVVLIDGQHWKKIADNCGFAKNSACFVPDRLLDSCSSVHCRHSHIQWLEQNQYSRSNKR